jgi:hypothetical protein
VVSVAEMQQTDVCPGCENRAQTLLRFSHVLGAPRGPGKEGPAVLG